MTRNNRGYTLSEVLVGLGLIVVIGFAFSQGIIQMRKATSQTALLSATDRQVSDIAENIKAGVETYQINFKYNKPVADILSPDKLPMAWDTGKVASRSDCPQCAGTYGYTIQPFEQFRGLYKVTLRMTHKSWHEPFRDYIFVVSAK